MYAVCLALRRSALPQAAIFSSLAIATYVNLCYAPHYPWYFLWLLPPLTIYPWRPALYLVLAATFLFATQLGAAGEPMYMLNKLLYGGFFLLLAIDFTGSRFSLRMRALGQSIFQPRAATISADQLADAREV